MTHKDIIAEHFEPREAVFSRRVRGYVGVCPFHTEKTGSCNYNVEKDTFYCFGCGANGTGEELARAITEN